MKEMMVAIAISKTLLNMSFLAETICTTHSNQPRGIVMSASMNDLVVSLFFFSKKVTMGIPVETDNTDESSTHSTDQDRLPPRIVDRSSHEDIQVPRSIINRDFVVYHIPI